jgi:ABC-type sugar transport system ATPase subunit
VSSPPLVEVDGLTKRFPGVVAVDNIHLSLVEGQIAGLVGKNGAGKSTLIQILAGALAPDAGTIKIQGREQAHLSPHVAAIQGLSFVHQNVIGVGSLTVAENVQLGLGFPQRLGYIKWSELFARTRRVLDSIGADIDPRAEFSALSIAQQRLVTIARAMAQKAKLIVLDEPTAALTDREIDRLFRILRQLRDDGVGVVFVSHRLDEILDLCDRAIVMRDGRVVDDNVTRAMTRAHLIAKITGDGSSRADDLDQRIRTNRAPGKALLEVSDFGDGHRVKGVSFQLHAGEVLGLGGLVGSGRTELVRLLYGADRRLTGELKVDGRLLKGASPRAALRAGIALLPEDRGSQGLHMDFPVAWNIVLPNLRSKRWFRGLPLVSRKAERSTARQHIKHLAIKARSPEITTRALSGGNQQKVMIAKWLEHGARIFIFDEPTKGVDVDGKEEIYRLMEDVAAAGSGVIFISSEFTELVRLCDRVVVLREGHVAGILTGDAISINAIVGLCYSQ